MTPASEADLEGKTIQEITITGLRSIRETYVRDRLASRVGEPYSEEKAERDRQRLDRFGVFRSIEMEAVAVAEGVAVHIEVVEGPSFLPYPSFEVTDENGVAVGGGVKAASLFGRPLSLSASAGFGGSTNIEVTAM
ncbi:MAG: hypothetical protein GY953_27225, partial [bacterium]|nr:hypothetical protein [bacterium]